MEVGVSTTPVRDLSEGMSGKEFLQREVHQMVESNEYTVALHQGT